MSSSLKSYKIASRFCEHNQNVWGLSLLKRRTKIFVFNYGFPIRLLLLVLLGFIGVAGHGGGSSQPSHSTTSIPTTRSHEDFYNNAAEHLLTSQEIVEFHSEKLFDKSNFSLPNSTKNKNSTKDDEDDNDLSSSASINISHQSKLSYNKKNNNHANNAKKVMPKSRKKDSSHQHPHHSEPLEMSHRLDEEFKDSNSVPVVPIELPPPNDTIHYHYTDDLDSNLQFYTDFTRIPLPSSSFSPFSSTTAHYSSSTNVPLPNSSESPYYLQDYIKLDEDYENNRNFDKRVKVQQSTKNNNNNYHRNNNNKNNSSVLRASTQSKSKSNNKQQWSQSQFENGQSTRRKPYTNIDDIPLDSSSSENSPIHYRPDGPQNYENNYQNYNYDSQSTNNKNNRLKRRRPEPNSHRNTEQNRIFYDESPFVINSKRKNENQQSYQDHDYNYNDEEEEDNNNDDDHFKQHQHNYYIKSNKENELSSSRNHEISRDKKYQDDLTSHQLLADSKSKNTIKDFEKSEEKLEEFESKKIIGKSVGPKNILKSGGDGGSSSPVSKVLKEGSSKSKSKKSEKTISDPSSSSKNKINSSSSSHNNNFNRNSTMLSDNSLEDVNLSFQDESASSDNDDEDGGSLMRRRPRRSVVHLYDMVVCATGCNPLAYKGYGCYCGFLGSGLTVDGIDRCCAKHDWCYHAAKCPPLLTYFVPYYWVCNDGRPRCVTDYRGWKGMCGANLCECDRQFAECLRKFPCPRSRAMCMTSPWRNLPIGPNLVFLA